MRPDIIEERTVELANYIIETRCTVREAAKKFGISKSTVHKDITERLKEVSPPLHARVGEVLKKNKEERLRDRLIPEEFAICFDPSAEQG